MLVISLRRLTAVALTLGLHFSLCTGGLLSVASAFAVEVGRANLDTRDLMTPALADMSLCATMTPAPEDDQPEDEAAAPTEASGCAEGKACLLSSTVGGRERLSQSLDQAYFVISIEAPLTVFVPDSGEPPGIARSGPRHESARLLASVLLKRE